MDSRLSFDGLELGNIVGWDVALLLGSFASSQPPVSLSVIDDFQVLSFFEAQVLVCPGIIVIQSHKDLGTR